jgi:hypothetical protein
VTIISASGLTSRDIARLGNNIGGPAAALPPSLRRRPQRLLVAAVNRSLAVLGERVARLDRSPMQAASGPSHT